MRPNLILFSLNFDRVDQKPDVTDNAWIGYIGAGIEFHHKTAHFWFINDTFLNNDIEQH
jgi:hypothetical protein